MYDRAAVLDLLFEAIDDVNATLEGPKLAKGADTVLFGQGGRLDSLGLVNLIVTLEQLVEERFGINITLASERAMSLKDSPFRSVASLAEYTTEVCVEAEAGGG